MTKPITSETTIPLSHTNNDEATLYPSMMKPPYIHPTADVQSSHIGEGTRIWQHCVVLEGARIGRDCNLCFNVFVENDVVVGNEVTVKSGVQLWDGVELEDKVSVGPNATFTNDHHPRSRQVFELKRTLVKQGASIGANSTIVGGVTIGAWALIGAGSVVTKDVPPHTLWYGNPARQQGYVCTCGERLDEQLHCTGCNKTYKQDNNGIIKQQP